MSFRYISALPTCLHGRLTKYTTDLVSSLSTYRRCNSGFAHAVAATHHDSRRDLETPLDKVNQAYKIPHHAGSKPQRTTVPARHRSERDALLRKVPNTLQPGVAATSSLRPLDRVGTVLDIPTFVNSLETPNNSESIHVEGEELPLFRKVELEEGKGVYKNWEDLHDKFLEVRRTKPDETNEIFKEQRLFARRFLGNITSSEVSALEFRCKWLALDKVEQTKVLPTLLIGSLAESASHVLFVLSNLERIPYSFLIRMNCLRSTGLMYWKKLQQNSELKEVYEALIEKLRAPDAWPDRKFPTSLLQNLLFWSTPEQCQKIIRDFSIKYPDAESSATITIIDHYLRIEDREQAFEYFQKLPKASLHEPDAIVTSLRDRLLKLDYVAENELGTNFKYLPKLLALGVPSDEALHNTVIESAILNEMPDVAWDVYQYLESSKFQSNARSHLVLLRDSFLRGDLQRVNQLMTAMHSREELLSDQYLLAYAMNIVRNISCYDKHLGPSEAHTHIMALYDRAYDRSPLIRLGIAQPSSSSSALQQPSPTLLAFTVWTHILVQRNDKEVLSLWEWVKYLIVNRDTAVMQAATYDIIYNGLILYHARKPTSLFRSLDIMQYMLSSDLCLPTARTWSIIMCAFLRHGQTVQAERIMALMQSRGYKVETITEQYGDYIPAGYDVKSMAAHVSRNLDERNMPEGLEQLMAMAESTAGDKVNIV